MKPLLGIAAFVVAAACPVALVGHGSAASPGASPAAADTPVISLVHQELALAVDSPLKVQFHPSAPMADGGSVRVLTYPVVANRETLARAIDGQFAGATDRVDVSSAAVETDPDGNITITVSTESEASSEESLRFPTPGLYPLAIQLLGADGDVVGQLVTFVDRLPPDGGDPPATISVALLASITAPPQLPNTTTPLPPDVTTALAELAKYPAELPISLDISPDIISRLDSATLTTVATVMGRGVIMSQPLVPLDPSAAAAADLGERFSNLLLAGETAIGATGQLPALPTRSVWFASQGITDEGARMLRKLGVRLLVIPSDVYLRADGNNGGLTDYSQLFQTAIGTDDASAESAGTDPASADSEDCAEASAGCLPTASIDPTLSARLADANLSDEQAALYTAADIVTYRDFFAQDMLANSRHALVLGLDGVGVAGAARVTRVAAMTTAVGATNFIPISDLEANSTQAIPDGRQLVLHLAQPTPIDLRARARTIDVLSFTTPTVSSMLAADDERIKRWDDTVGMLYSTSLTEAEVLTAVAALDDEMKAIKACVIQPEPYPFTLPGRSIDLPLRLTNTCAYPLNVVVRLSAAAGKMDVVPPEGTPLTIPANATQPFTIALTARTNGAFDVTLDVLTPVGQAPITKPVKLRARVFSLTGLPQAITGVALLLLLTWWGRNLRRSRRARRSMAAAAAHPAVGG